MKIYNLDEKSLQCSSNIDHVDKNRMSMKDHLKNVYNTCTFSWEVIIGEEHFTLSIIIFCLVSRQTWIPVSQRAWIGKTMIVHVYNQYMYTKNITLLFWSRSWYQPKLIGVALQAWVDTNRSGWYQRLIKTSVMLFISYMYI